jgi:hypothetical protein
MFSGKLFYSCNEWNALYIALDLHNACTAKYIFQYSYETVKWNFMLFMKVNTKGSLRLIWDAQEE